MNTPSRTTLIMRWTARIWSALIIAYAALMLGGYAWNLITLGTADPYAVEDVSFLESLPPILMLISAFTLAAAFRWERPGAWATVFLQIVVIILVFVQNPTFEVFSPKGIPYLLALIVIAPAILFLLCARRTHHARGT